jgi:hypothetical protein
MQRGALVTGTIMVFLWIGIFAAGTIISSQPFREALDGKAELGIVGAIKAWLIVITCYTVTNVAILCCLSSVLGGLYRYSSRKDSDTDVEFVPRMKVLPYLIQGFVIYLSLVSGLLLLGEGPFMNLSPDKYLRLAGSASFLSFISGYDPRMLIRMMERFAQLTEEQKSSNLRAGGGPRPKHDAAG